VPAVVVVLVMEMMMVDGDAEKDNQKRTSVSKQRQCERQGVNDNSASGARVVSGEWDWWADEDWVK